MKNMNTMKNRLNTAAASIRTHGQKAFKHPITSILSLCLVAGIAATIAGFSQAPTEKNGVPAITPPAASPEVATLGTTMPVARTLTSADGRTIDVTILSKSPTAIKAARAVGKEFEIALDKLSETDREFVAGLGEAPVKKRTMLCLSGLQKIDEKMKKAGFEITALDEVDELKTMTDRELESFDVILVSRHGASRGWSSFLGHPLMIEGSDNYVQRERILKLAVAGKVVVWRGYYETSKKEFIKHKLVPTLFKGNGLQRDQIPFVKIDDNIIFFSYTSQIDTDSDSKASKERDTGGEVTHPEIFDQVVVEIINLVKRKSN